MSLQLLIIVCLSWLVVKISRYQILSRFLLTATVSPQSAKQLKDLGVTDTILVKAFVFQGILKVVDDGQYYLDLDRKFQYEKKKSTILIGGASVAIIVFVIVFFFILH
jgi:hypothetical protein